MIVFALGLVVAPPVTSSIVNLTKSSGIVATIAIFDLTNDGRDIIADAGMIFQVWPTVAAM